MVFTQKEFSKLNNVAIFWNDLNQNSGYYYHSVKGNHTSFVNKIRSNRKKTMVKYLEFFLNEYVVHIREKPVYNRVDGSAPK